jgi:hypothetical protein
MRGLHKILKVRHSVLTSTDNEEELMATTLRIKPGLLRRLREVRGIPSEEAQARLIGVDRTTLRRIDAGGVPSTAFICLFFDAFGLGPGEAFEFVSNDPINQRQPTREAVAA